MFLKCRFVSVGLTKFNRKEFRMLTILNGMSILSCLNFKTIDQY